MSGAELLELARKYRALWRSSSITLGPPLGERMVVPVPRAASPPPRRRGAAARLVVGRQDGMRWPRGPQFAYGGGPHELVPAAQVVRRVHVADGQQAPDGASIGWLVQAPGSAIARSPTQAPPSPLGRAATTATTTRGGAAPAPRRLPESCAYCTARTRAAGRAARSANARPSRRVEGRSGELRLTAARGKGRGAARECGRRSTGSNWPAAAPYVVEASAWQYRMVDDRLGENAARVAPTRPPSQPHVLRKRLSDFAPQENPQSRSATPKRALGR